MNQKRHISYDMAKLWTNIIKGELQFPTYGIASIICAKWQGMHLDETNCLVTFAMFANVTIDTTLNILQSPSWTELPQSASTTGSFTWNG